MAKLETEKKDLEARLADPAFYATGNAAEIQAAVRRSGEVTALLAADEERWLEIHAELEEIGDA
jgi:ATP-binding cassette subfamily F protein 3